MDNYINKPLIEKLLRKNILVIDDEGLITKTLCDLLKRAGFYADSSESGTDAVDKTKDSDFDLIISDIKMPDMDGIQAVRRIKDIARAKNRPEPPVIFITGYPEAEITKEAHELGEVLLKPFDTKEFLNRVAKYI